MELSILTKYTKKSFYSSCQKKKIIKKNNALAIKVLTIVAPQLFIINKNTVIPQLVTLFITHLTLSNVQLSHIFETMNYRVTTQLAFYLFKVN